MSDDHLGRLHEARESLVKRRRELAVTLVGPYSRGKTEEAQGRFIGIQNLIDAVDKAIDDEESKRPSVYKTRGLRDAE